VKEGRIEGRGEKGEERKKGTEFGVVVTRRIVRVAAREGGERRRTEGKRGKKKRKKVGSRMP